MSVDGEVRRLKGEADEPGWEVEPDDDWGLAVIATVGRQLRLRRESVGMRAGEFGKAVGYGEDMVYKLEGGNSAGDAPGLAWFKSSYSSGSEGDSCIEVATVPGTVHVRDSKQAEGPRLALTPGAWADFVTYASGS